MKRMFSLALMCAFVVTESAGLGAQDPTGVISGSILSATGRGLSGITVQLVDARGTVVGKTETKNGVFEFPAMRYDTYTVQCVRNNKVAGTTSARLQAATESVTLSCGADIRAAWWKHGGVMTGLVAAVSAIGAAAVVATAGDASGSR